MNTNGRIATAFSLTLGEIRSFRLSGKDSEPLFLPELTTRLASIHDMVMSRCQKLSGDSMLLPSKAYNQVKAALDPVEPENLHKLLALLEISGNRALDAEVAKYRTEPVKLVFTQVSPLFVALFGMLAADIAQSSGKVMSADVDACLESRGAGLPEVALSVPEFTEPTDFSVKLEVPDLSSGLYYLIYILKKLRKFRQECGKTDVPQEVSDSIEHVTGDILNFVTEMLAALDDEVDDILEELSHETD